MNDITWDPPGAGPWELDATHFARPMSRFSAPAWKAGLVRGFAEGTARYGILFDHFEPGLVNGFVYLQPVPFAAPDGATRPPPKPLLWLLLRLSTKVRARVAVGARAFTTKLWREDLRTWDIQDRPAATARNRFLQQVAVAELTDGELAEHLRACHDNLVQAMCLRQRHTVTTGIPTGDFLRGAMSWTGATSGEVLALLRGSSPISTGFAAEELDEAGRAIAASGSAVTVLDRGGPAEGVLHDLAGHNEVGAVVTAYLEVVRLRSVGYDVADKTAGELPEMLVAVLRSAASGSSAQPQDDQALAVLRARVPAAHLEEFDERLAEARLMNRLRDERTVLTDGWATGLARRALLEVGRRLVEQGRLADREHSVDLDVREATSMLRGADGPTADEVETRYQWRTTTTTDKAPPFLRALPPPPPPISTLPKKAQRPSGAMIVFGDEMFQVTSASSDAGVRGLGVNDGQVEGTARLVETADDFVRLSQGDVLVTRMTSPFFNVVLPLLGGIVTDRGGQLCHAAIVAREYGVPGVVGTRDATAKIRDGARVRVDGTSGEVRLVS